MASPPAAKDPPREQQNGQILQDVERGATNSRDSSTVADTTSTEGDATQNNGGGTTTTTEHNGQAMQDPKSDPEPEASRTKLETTLIMLALCSGLFLAALDVTIISTAVPTIVGDFQSASGYTWIGSAYTLANAATVPSWGKISDIWGRKPILLLCVATFWVGSLLCAVSVNMGMLIAARAIQGAGSGGIIVLVNISISDLFSIRSRGVYYGYLGMVWAISSAIGPVVGGAFTTGVTWRWCFYINLPISAIGFAILVFVLKLHNPKTSMKAGLAAVDWLGSLLVIGGTLMFLFGLEFGGITYPWNSAPPICLIVFGIVTIGLFLVVEQRVATYPVIPLRLFQSPRRVITFIVSFCHAFVFIAGSYYLPLYFQGVLGASPLFSGVYVLPYVLSLSFGSAVVGIVTKKTGRYLPQIVFGMAVMTLGFGLFINLDTNKNWAKIILYQIVAGIGVGPNFQSPLIALHALVERRDISTATSTFQFFRQLSTSISVVIGGVIFQNGMEKQYPSLLQSLGPELANQLSGSSAGGSVGVVATLPGEQGQIAREAYWVSLKTMFILYTAVGGLGMLLSPFIGESKLDSNHKEQKTGLKALEATREKGESK